MELCGSYNIIIIKSLHFFDEKKILKIWNIKYKQFILPGHIKSNVYILNFKNNCYNARTLINTISFINNNRVLK